MSVAVVQTGVSHAHRTAVDVDGEAVSVTRVSRATNRVQARHKVGGVSWYLKRLPERLPMWKHTYD